MRTDRPACRARVWVPGRCDQRHQGSGTLPAGRDLVFASIFAGGVAGRIHPEILRAIVSAGLFGVPNDHDPGGAHGFLPIRIVEHSSNRGVFLQSTRVCCGATKWTSPRPRISAITTARHVESWRPNTSSRLFPSKHRANRSWQILSLRTFRSGWRAECSARSTVPSFSGRQRSARCPNVRLPYRRRPSCRCRRRRFPYHSDHR